MMYRMGAALMSLIGLFVSAYLYLYKIGRIGTLACGSGACEMVQTSQWSRFAGVEVALIGVVGYALLFAAALLALQPALATRRWPADLLTALAALGVLFTAYLTWLELFVIHAICRWCIGSAAIIVSVLLLALLARRRAPEPRPA
ncbi:MAG TPA: vitamin K epoxide reductase family protein [Gemmatimonadales bacterium]|nr:vitamin K epoxide reductase family protein [Gemmatimonadales bacterium]